MQINLKFVVFGFLFLLISCEAIDSSEKAQSHQLKKSYQPEESPGAFRVKPYVQNPAMDAATLIWFSYSDTVGTVVVQEQSGGEAQTLVSEPVQASALAYSPLEIPDLAEGQSTQIPYQHQIRVTGLSPSSSYSYSVEQSGETLTSHFQTAGNKNSLVRIIVYADSETEPESTGKYSKWPAPKRPGVETEKKRRYLVDQTTGYRENLNVIAQRNPDFIAIAGDLVQSGGEQRDWDEFWHHNESIAANTPIVPALGNHEYYAGPGDFDGWNTLNTETSVSKFKTYFDLPDNGASNDAHNERYYAMEYGPVTLIVLDPTNGDPHQTPTDTNWSMLGEKEGGVAPAWSKGSDQYGWLESELARAQKNSRFTFVMFHYCPYTSGVHGLPPGPYDEGKDNTSSLPLQALTPLFMKYGVGALLNGHDEMVEHSIVPGEQLTLEGDEVEHQLHVYDTGIGGDGLRGPHPNVSNPYKHFLAHEDAPEIYDDQGVLVDGGKHYGHLEINIAPDAEGQWQAEMDLVYIFPVTNTTGDVLQFERRIYDDPTVLFE